MPYVAWIAVPVSFVGWSWILRTNNNLECTDKMNNDVVGFSVVWAANYAFTIIGAIP